MKVKHDDKQSGRTLNDVGSRGCYEVLKTLCGSLTECEVLVHSVDVKGRAGLWHLSLGSALDRDEWSA